ncbi:MAG: phosphatase PAP2 family protein [Firmicutes bacterium]|nr:phosphatase PAP2 family protein [Bacillota bacterium]
MSSITLFDLDILNYIQNNFRTAIGDYFWQFMTMLGDGGIFFLILSISLIVFPKTRETGVRILFALVMCFIFGNVILKNAFARLRPFYVVESFNLLISAPEGYSFPSGHAEASFAVATVFFLTNRRYVMLYVLAACIGFSRLYLFVHYPSDVFFGMILGIIFGYLSYHIIDFEKFKRHRGDINDNWQL